MRGRIVLLPGDGIGPEVTDAAVEILQTIGKIYGHEWIWERALIGGIAIDQTGSPLPHETLAICRAADAVLLGAVGGPKWDSLPAAIRPEAGLLAIRHGLKLYANIRPVKMHPTLLSASPLKAEIIEDVDFIILRELTGGIYFGERMESNGKFAYDTMYYSVEEIQRIIHRAFSLAMMRKNKVTSIDKANVLATSRLWRQIVNEIAPLYPQVSLEHLYVDNASMQLITRPGAFDVIVTENLFGDILSDEASVLNGSIGMLCSASISDQALGLYEPVHGSAPDIAGKDMANPLAAILSTALMLRYSFMLYQEAEAVEKAVGAVLEQGWRTRDIAYGSSAGNIVGTQRMASKVNAALIALHA